MKFLYIPMLSQLIVFICIGCLSAKKQQSTAVKSIDISFGIKNPKNRIQNNLYNNHIGLIYFNEFTLIKEYYDDYTTSSTSYKGDTPITKFDNPVVKYFYYVFDTSKKYFYKVRSLDINVEPKKIELDLDSLYEKKAALSYKKLYSAIKPNLIQIDSVKINKHSYVYIYGAKEKPDATYSDSAFFYYNTNGEFNDIPFSFAKELDLTGKGKLYKTEIIYNENPKGNTDYEKMEKIATFEMKRVSESNADSLILFLDHFKSKFVDVKNN